MMKAKIRARRLAKQYGVEIIVAGGRHAELTVLAPPKQHWLDGGNPLHELVVSAWDDEEVEDLWETLAERMASGLGPCLEDDCDH